MSRGRSETTTKVFVGSLPAGVTTDDLRKLFEPYGTIAECDIANRCGFLHLEDNDLAMKAISDLNGTDFMGGKISVEKGRVKPRRNGGGPMRGGKDRGGPYSRGGGGDFRGPRGYGGGRDYPPFRGGGDRFGGGGGYDRPQRGGFGGGFEDRRGGFEDRRGGGYQERFDRRPYQDRGPAPYGDAPRGGGGGGGFDDRRGPVGGFEDRRPPMGNDRRSLMDPPGPRGGPGGYDGGRGGGGAGAADLFSRRDQGGLKGGPGYLQKFVSNVLSTIVGGFRDRGYGGTNGYGSGANGGGYGSAPAAGGYGGGGGYNSMSAVDDYGDRGGYGGGASDSYGSTGGYGDNYGAGGGGAGGARGTYDTAYPPLPQQRGLDLVCHKPDSVERREDLVDFIEDYNKIGELNMKS
ncbi:hypothetical protein NQ317_008138 [Molorchus minor]|uniref:RRM domain-containing protein n=1 Tax=Molorchus minor TaxID=1323400 RepID=A0ABQ9JKM1_9CUCU|nr:hypothetical protein NQ317_008138 [Molorchus minor]